MDVGSTYFVDTLGTRLQFARNAAGLTQDDVAGQFGIRRASVAGWETNATRPDQAKIPQLVSMLNTTYDWLFEGKGDAPRPVEAARVKGEKPQMVPITSPFAAKRGHPIYAAAQGGDGHLMVTTDPIEYGSVPNYLEGVRDAYGIIVTGESMVPAYNPGDVAHVHPHLPPLPGKPVILWHVNNESGDQEIMIKILVRSSPKEWVLRQYNPPKEFSVSRKEWTRCHRVMGKEEAR